MTITRRDILMREAAPALYEACLLAQKWLANSVPIVVDLDEPTPLPVLAAAIAKAEGRA